MPEHYIAEYLARYALVSIPTLVVWIWVFAKSFRSRDVDPATVRAVRTILIALIALIFGYPAIQLGLLSWFGFSGPSLGVYERFTLAANLTVSVIHAICWLVAFKLLLRLPLTPPRREIPGPAILKMLAVAGSLPFILQSGWNLFYGWIVERHRSPDLWFEVGPTFTIAFEALGIGMGVCLLYRLPVPLWVRLTMIGLYVPLGWWALFWWELLFAAYVFGEAL